MASCLARAFRFPPSLELLRNLCLNFGRCSFSSAEKLLRSSRGVRALDIAGTGGAECSDLSLRPNAPSIDCVVVTRFLRGLIGGTGGGGPSLAIPLLRLAPGGRLIVVTLEVEETNVGSEMSDFCIDFFR